MANIKEDILSELSLNKIKKLRDLYKEHRDYAPHIYSFLNTTLKWIEKRPKEKYITVYCIDNNYDSDGTFIAHMQFHCYDFLLFSLNKQCDLLYRGLTETRKFRWMDHHCLFYVVHNDHAEMVHQAMHTLNLHVHYSSLAHLWNIPEEKALSMELGSIPDDYYIKPIRSEDALVINAIWPPRYRGSTNHLRVFIEMNGGYGVYKKKDDELVSWVLKNAFGQLGVLQTKDDHKKLGLGNALVRKLVKEVAREGHDPFATSYVGNVPSEMLFGKLGFVKLDYCYLIGIGKQTDHD